MSDEGKTESAHIGARRPPPRTGARQTRAAMERTLEVVERYLVERRSRNYISKKLELPLRTVADYIARVHARWQAEGEATRETRREAMLARLAYLSGRAERARAWSAAASLERLAADVEGLRVQRHEVTGLHGAPLTVSPQDAAATVAAAVERAIAARAAASAADPPAAPEATEPDSDG